MTIYCVDFAAEGRGSCCLLCEGSQQDWSELYEMYEKCLSTFWLVGEIPLVNMSPAENIKLSIHKLAYKMRKVQKRKLVKISPMTSVSNR